MIKTGEGDEGDWGFWGDKSLDYYLEHAPSNPNLVDPREWLIGVASVDYQQGVLIPELHTDWENAWQPFIAENVAFETEYGAEGIEIVDDVVDVINVCDDEPEGYGWTQCNKVRITYFLNPDYIVGENDEFVVDFGNSRFMPANFREVTVAVVEDLTSRIDACDGCGQNHPVTITNIIPGPGVKYMNEWSIDDYLECTNQVGGMDTSNYSGWPAELEGVGESGCGPYTGDGYPHWGLHFNLPLYGPDNITYNNDSQVYWNGLTKNFVGTGDNSAVDYAHYFKFITNTSGSGSLGSVKLATVEAEIQQYHHQEETFYGFIEAEAYPTQTTETPTSTITTTAKGFFRFMNFNPWAFGGPGFDSNNSYVLLEQPSDHTVDKLLNNWPTCYDFEYYSYLDPNNGQERTAVTKFKFDIWFAEPSVGTNLSESEYPVNYVPFGSTDGSELQYFNYNASVVNPSQSIALNPFVPQVGGEGSWSDVSYSTQQTIDFGQYEDGFNVGQLAQYNSIALSTNPVASIDPSDFYQGTDDYESMGFFGLGSWRGGLPNYLVQSGGPNGTGNYQKVFPALPPTQVMYDNAALNVQQPRFVQYPWIHPDYTITVTANPSSGYGREITEVGYTEGGLTGDNPSGSDYSTTAFRSIYAIESVKFSFREMLGSNRWNIIPSTGILPTSGGRKSGPTVTVKGKPGAVFSTTFTETKTIEINSAGGGKSVGSSSVTDIQLNGGKVPDFPEGDITIPSSGVYKFKFPEVDPLTITEGWKEYIFELRSKGGSTILETAPRKTNNNEDVTFKLTSIGIGDGIKTPHPYDNNAVAINLYQYPNVSVKLTTTKAADWDYYDSNFNLTKVEEIGGGGATRSGIPLDRVRKKMKIELRLRKLSSTFTLNENALIPIYNPVKAGSSSDPTISYYAVNPEAAGIIVPKVKDNKDIVYWNLRAHLGQGISDNNTTGDYITIVGSLFLEQYGLRPQEFDLNLTKIFINA
jgi:hypothetical protein